MKKKVLLLNCLGDGVSSMDVRDYYLFFRGRYTEDSFLLTSIGNFTSTMKSLTIQDLTSDPSFLSFLPIPLTRSTKFLLRADVRGVKSILKLTVNEEKLVLEPFTYYDELTDEMFYHIVECFTLQRKDKYLSFLLHPRKGRTGKSSNHPDDHDDNTVRFVR
ncbi:hypothetical protein ACOJQI_21600 [Bacillus salacetis]|uniref:hypothetical protein n=1 Tax=Bacillus salacetis TaxID=2315464 RepID=UPI003BA2B4F5